MQITLNNLVKTYSGATGATDVHAVSNVSLSIPSNSVYGIIGKSGAGKSTLVRLISLLEKPDSGEVFYGDKRVDTLDGKDLIAQRRRIGMIFQSFNLFASRTAAKNIAYPLEICKTPRAEINKRVAELLDLVGLADKANAAVSQLSGGQKQRIAIARSLAVNPQILFCDEATSALDPQTTRSILSLIRDIQKKMQLTVVMITHQMEVVRDACDYVAVLDSGAVMEQGTVSEIFTHPKTAVTKDFLANLTQNIPDTASDVSSGEASIVRWSQDGGKYTLRFVNQMTGEPVLSRMAHLYPVEFNIRAGGIQHIASGDVGTLITDITGSPEALSGALQYLKSQGVIIEEN